jgi:hypothetical protein
MLAELPQPKIQGNTRVAQFEFAAYLRGDPFTRDAGRSFAPPEKRLRSGMTSSFFVANLGYFRVVSFSFHVFGASKVAEFAGP